jgi:hypothetical protein
MAKLYRQHVLKEQPTLEIQGLGASRAKAVTGTTGSKSPEPAEVLHKPVF